VRARAGRGRIAASCPLWFTKNRWESSATLTPETASTARVCVCVCVCVCEHECLCSGSGSIISSLLPLPVPPKPHFSVATPSFLSSLIRSPPPRDPLPQCPDLSPFTPLSPSYRLSYPLFYHPPTSLSPVPVPLSSLLSPLSSQKEKAEGGAGGEEREMEVGRLKRERRGKEGDEDTDERERERARARASE